MRRIVIIGGGITGLAAAHRVIERGGFEVTLIEGGPRVGGIIETRERDGYLLECGPDSFLGDKPAAVDLVRRLGLESRLIETNSNHRRSFIVSNGQLLPIPADWWPRMELDAEGDESLAQFVRRRMGREALERMVQPIIGGIYTADPEKLSVRATLPRFGSNYGSFRSFDRGMQVLADNLRSQISDLKLNTTVESIEPSWKIKTNRGETLTADAVCLALPAYASARLLQYVDTQLAAELSSIQYASSATINLAYKRQDVPHALEGFGFVVPFIEKRTLMACTFSSVKFAGRAPEGGVLLRAFVGGALQPELTELNDAELIERVRHDLRDLLGVEQPPLFTEVSKWKESMPQYHVGHLDRVARIEERAARLPGLALAGNAYHGVGIPDCISSGESAANKLVDSIAGLE